jgi:hypothetical protein
VVNSSLNVFDSRRLDPGHFEPHLRCGQAVRLLLSLYETDPPGLFREALRLIGRFDAAPALDNEPSGRPGGRTARSALDLILEQA